MRNHRAVFGPAGTLVLAVGVVTPNLRRQNLRRLLIGFLLQRWRPGGILLHG
jgi:hypothetical protein